MTFFRYPSTPHLAWLGNGSSRNDKILFAEESAEFLSERILVEEKIDGANVGFSVDENGVLQAQNRGTILVRGECHPQFKPLFPWLSVRRSRLAEVLERDRIIFGEWCYAKHSVNYRELPDWFVAFDVYDRLHGRFLDVRERDEVLHSANLSVVPKIAAGVFNLAGLQSLFGPSRFGGEMAEGLYLRRDHGAGKLARAKLVNPVFHAGIAEHWSKRHIEPNALARTVLGLRTGSPRP